MPYVNSGSEVRRAVMAVARKNKKVPRAKRKPTDKMDGWNQAVKRLHHELDLLGLEKSLAAVVTLRGQNRKVAVYYSTSRQKIDAGILFRAINLSIEKDYGHVAFPFNLNEILRPKSWRTGYFIPASMFGLDEAVAGRFVAVINCPMAEEAWPAEAIPFPRRPLV